MAKEIWFLVLAAIVVAGLAIYMWRNRMVLAEKCGHWTKVRGQMVAFDTRTQATLIVESGKAEYCHECLGKMAIRCAWCRKAIFPGQYVSLYLAPQGERLPKGSKDYFHENGARSFVGCMGCAELGFADAQGVWMPPGRVERIPSGIERAMAAFQQGAKAYIE